MSSNPAGLRFFQCANIGMKDSLEQAMDAVKDAGFDVGAIRAWSDNVNSLAFVTKDYNEEAAENMPLAYKFKNLTWTSVDEYSHLILTFKFGWALTPEGTVADALIYVYTDETRLFTRKILNPEHHSQRFLHLGERLYRMARPRYGWIERLPYWRPETAGYTTEDDIRKLELPHVYWANFFGPAFVTRLGKDFLMQAPRWKCEELDDGGLLYVLTPSLAGTGPVAFVREVQKYFGVEHVRRRPRKPRQRAKQ